jgi:dihydrolipoamide dehydrogenase
MTERKKYDLFVIGGGPGGYTAALLGSKKGLRVAIAEGSQFGGTCTNRGCIPAKTYIESVNLYTRMQDARRFGIDSGAVSLPLESLHRRKSRIVTRLVKGIEYLLDQAGVDIYRGHARFESEREVRIGDDAVASSSIIIATGSRPKRPPFLAVDGSLTSDEIFDLRELPRSLVIVGGGVIGLEMAHVFSNLGAEVIVIEALERVLATEDEEASSQVASVYRKVRFMTGARIRNVEKTSGFRLTVGTSAGEEIVTGEALLLCIGREPVIPEGLGAPGMSLSPTGGIVVDGSMRTGIPGVYAIGDVTGEQMYAYVASKEAAVAVDAITGGKETMNYSAIPSVVFTSPEIASVGRPCDAMPLTKGTFPVSALGRARTMESSEGYASVYCGPDGRILKVTIMAPHATELISWATLAVEQGLQVEDFLRPHCPHPTMAELIKEAAEDVLGLSIHKP